MNTESNNRLNQILVWSLILLFAVFMVLGFLFRSDGGINLDTIEYVRLSDQFPFVKSNVFPIGYPCALKIMQFFTKEYFWSSKILNVLCLIFILVFSWEKKFYFQETLLVLATKIGIGLWPFSISEPLFLSLFYVQIYFVHFYFNNPTENSNWVWKMSFLMLGLCLVRHIGVFVFAGYLVAGVFLLLKTGRTAYYKYQDYYRFLVNSGCMLLAYLTASYFIFGSVFGENYRGEPEAITQQETMNHLILNFKGLVNGFNPFFTLIFQHNSPNANPLPVNLVLVIDLLLLGVYSWFIIKRFRPFTSLFYSMVLLVSVVFLSLMFFSSMAAGIENLGPRLLAPALFILYFVFIILFRRTYSQFWRYALVTGILSLFINLGFLLKTPASYLSIHAQAGRFLEKHPAAKYFYVDSDSTPVTKYPIPFTQISLEYQHPVLARSYISRHALFIINPDLQEIPILHDSIPQEQLIYNSKVIP